MRGLTTLASPVATAGGVELGPLASPLAKPDDAGQVKTVTVPAAPVVVVPLGAALTELGGGADGPTGDTLGVGGLGAG